MMLHELLTARRNAMNMSIDELTERSGVKKGTLTKIITGVTPSPSLENVRSIANALGMTLDDLYEAKEKKFTSNDFDLLHKYNSLDAHGKAVVNAVLDLEYRRCAQSPETVAPPETSFSAAMESEGYTPKARPDHKQAE